MANRGQTYILPLYTSQVENYIYTRRKLIFFFFKHERVRRCNNLSSLPHYNTELLCRAWRQGLVLGERRTKHEKKKREKEAGERTNRKIERERKRDGLSQSVAGPYLTKTQLREKFVCVCVCFYIVIKKLIKILIWKCSTDNSLYREFIRFSLETFGRKRERHAMLQTFARIWYFTWKLAQHTLVCESFSRNYLHGRWYDHANIMYFDY